VPLLLSVAVFVFVGTAFIFINLTVGKLARPRLPNPDKGAAYECGEPTIGPTWVQFDVRFYIIALVFLVFDVEVALFYPWAIIYGDAAALAARVGSTLYDIRVAALIDMLVFFVILMTGFAYLWRFGFLDWARTPPTARTAPTLPIIPPPS
jgi:NADH-quinone oxidoreductase subunit A